MNEAELIRKAMSALGKRTSERKKISSRKNAKRPRKKKKMLDKFVKAECIAAKTEAAFVIGEKAGLIQPDVSNVYLDRSQFPKAWNLEI